MKDGKIRHWGVSNLDIDDMAELAALPGGDALPDQPGSLQSHPARHRVRPAAVVCAKRGMPIMAYSPIEQGRMLRNPALLPIAARHDATPAQIALAWVMRKDGIIAIPKASRVEHVKENRAALDIRLTENDLAALDSAFPPPKAPRSLEML